MIRSPGDVPRLPCLPPLIGLNVEAGIILIVLNRALNLREYSVKQMFSIGQCVFEVLAIERQLTDAHLDVSRFRSPDGRAQAVADEGDGVGMMCPRLEIDRMDSAEVVENPFECGGSQSASEQSGKPLAAGRVAIYSHRAIGNLGSRDGVDAPFTIVT